MKKKNSRQKKQHFSHIVKQLPENDQKLHKKVKICQGII